jgi:zinc protease
MTLVPLAALVMLAIPIMLSIPCRAASLAADTPELPFQKYTLPNGLQVILHQDSTTPMVAVNIWYHVGAKDEKPGRTGFAHLFEHMMFQGSRHHDDEYFLPLQKVGGAVNGSTDKDRTNYWETVPADQLERALWLEADRMGWLLPALTQQKLDNQRDVVKNEKRQSENEPYARSEELLLRLMYPQGHPYAWTVIGSMEDLSAATIDDVSEFFRQYYVPNNASLCVAGDFDPEQAKEWIARYFGSIPPGRPIDRVTGWTPTLDHERRAVAQDAVQLPRLYMSWHSPGYYQPGDAECDLLADVLTSGKNSRLYRALVYEQQIAQDVTARQESRQLGGTFTITATAAPGCGLDVVEAALDRELAKLLKDGIGADELKPAVTRTEAGFIRGLERVGGFGGKADRLNRYNLYTGDPGYLPRDLERYRAATAASVAEWARRCLGFDNRAVLHILPQGDLQAGPEQADRTGVPESSGASPFTPPAIQKGVLANGLEVFLVENHRLPLVEVHLTVLSGWSSDPVDRPGTAAQIGRASCRERV